MANTYTAARLHFDEMLLPQIASNCSRFDKLRYNRHPQLLVAWKENTILFAYYLPNKVQFSLDVRIVTILTNLEFAKVNCAYGSGTTRNESTHVSQDTGLLFTRFVPRSRSAVLFHFRFVGSARLFRRYNVRVRVAFPSSFLFECDTPRAMLIY